MPSTIDLQHSGARRPFAQSLRECAASALGALLAGTFAASMLLASWMVMVSAYGADDDGWFAAPAFGFVLMLPAFAFTAPVTFLFGLPVYAWLRARGQANVVTVLAAVVAAAVIAAMVVDGSMGPVVALYGACIGLLTHVFQRRRDIRG